MTCPLPQHSANGSSKCVTDSLAGSVMHVVGGGAHSAVGVPTAPCPHCCYDTGHAGLDVPCVCLASLWTLIHPCFHHCAGYIVGAQ